MMKEGTKRMDSWGGLVGMRIDGVEEGPGIGTSIGKWKSKGTR